MLGMDLKKTTSCTVVLGLLIFGGINGAFADGNIQLLFGNKSLDKDWEPVESRREGGIGVEFQKKDWPMAFVASYVFSEGTGTVSDPDFGITVDASGKTRELNVGGRMYLTNGQGRFFVEGGLASVSAKLEGYVQEFNVTIKDSDSAIGLWMGTGVMAKVSESMNTGLLVRASNTNVNLYEQSMEAGGTQIAVFVAFNFEK